MKMIKKTIKKIVLNILPLSLFLKTFKNCSNSIVLTFDDGPHPEITPLIINALDEKKVKGVFFFQGNLMEKYPEIVLMAYKSGHQITNHSYSHARKLNFSNFKQEISKTEKIIENICGRSFHLFRPPYGIVSLPLLLYCFSNGLKIVHWSFDSKDSLSAKRTEIADNVRSTVKGGDILLFHNDEKECASVIGEVVQICLDKGYHPVLFS